jgi:hypothetical protein
MNIIKCLFTIDKIEREIKNKNKLILGVSSLWISLILYDCWINQLYLLWFCLSSLTIISPWFWYSYTLNSYLHKLDKYLSISCGLYSLYYWYFYLYSHIYYYILLKSIIISFFLMSSYFYNNSNHKYQLYSHLLFRYFFFFLVYKTIHYNNYNLNNKNKFEIITYNYFFNSIYLIIIIDDNYEYDLKNYLFYCSQVLLNSYLCSLI